MPGATATRIQSPPVFPTTGCDRHATPALGDGVSKPWASDRAARRLALCAGLASRSVVFSSGADLSEILRWVPLQPFFESWRTVRRHRISGKRSLLDPVVTKNRPPICAIRHKNCIEGWNDSLSFVTIGGDRPRDDVATMFRVRKNDRACRFRNLNPRAGLL